MKNVQCNESFITLNVTLDMCSTQASIKYFLKCLLQKCIIIINYQMNYRTPYISSVTAAFVYI